MKKRAIRRHHAARMKKRAYDLITKNWQISDPILMASKMANHMAVCSCWTCGNQRNNLWEHTRFRLTMPERKQLDKEEADWIEYDQNVTA